MRSQKWPRAGNDRNIEAEEQAAKRGSARKEDCVTEMNGPGQVSREKIPDFYSNQRTRSDPGGKAEKKIVSAPSLMGVLVFLNLECFLRQGVRHVSPISIAFEALVMCVAAES